MRRRTAAALGVAVLLGVLLRVVWAGDMEFKDDEAMLFAHATGSDPWPGVGDLSGVGTVNPGMGIWVYSAKAQGLGLTTPVALARGVMAINVGALLALVAFSLRVVAPREREPWLWATALFAVSPLAILFSRKIWIQSPLPAFVAVVLLGWWRRGRAAGAFAWGLVGAWLGQIHLSGFFFAAALAAATAIWDRAGARWRWWLAGSLAGALSLIPWLLRVFDSPGGDRSLSALLELQFWRRWLTYPLGFDIGESFGSDLGGFLAWPTAGGSGAYLVAAVLVAILLGAMAVFVEAIAITVWPRKRERPRPLGGPRSSSAIAVRAAVWGYGLLLSVSGAYVYRHYLIVLFALPFVALAAAALLRPALGRRVLAGLVVAQAALSVLYLTYVHEHGGAPGGDYGVSYDAQHQTSSR